MKKLVILEQGTAGTMMLNKFHRVLDPMDWEITIVDHNETYFYQPDFYSFLSVSIKKKM